jgi:septation ring formation regulator EzrA
VSGDLEAFQRVAKEGHVSELVAMYQMLREEVNAGREAASSGIQLVQALRAQRIVNVEMEAELSLLRDAKIAAEGEVCQVYVFVEFLSCMYLCEQL